MTLRGGGGGGDPGIQGKGDGEKARALGRWEYGRWGGVLAIQVVEG